MKKTPLSESVMQVFATANKPLSVPELQRFLETKNLTPNKTTLYRMLERMQDENILEVLLLDPKVAYYELKKHHHHHFRCQNCDAIKCITDPGLESQIHTLEQKLEKNGLKIANHHFSLSGVCGACK